MDPIELVARRRALGLTQAELGQALGMNQIAISRWETGANQPRYPVSLTTALSELEDELAVEVEKFIELGEHASAVRDTPEVTLKVSRDDPLRLVAAAQAAAELRDDGIQVRVVELE